MRNKFPVVDVTTSRKSSRVCRTILLAIVSGLFICDLLFPHSVVAQNAEKTPAVATDADQVSVELIGAARKSVEQDGDLTTTVKETVLELYATALKRLNDELTYKEQFEKLKLAKENAFVDLQLIREKLDAAPPEIEKPAADADLPAIQQKITTLEEQVRLAEKAKQERDDEAARRAKRRTEVPGELTTARTDLDKTKQQLQLPPTDTDPLEVTTAKRRLLLARERALLAKVTFLESELPAYEATSALLSAQRDHALRQLSFEKKTFAAWQEFANRQRRTEAEKHRDEARELATNVAAIVKPKAEAVKTLAQSLLTERNILSTEIAKTNSKIQRIEALTSSLKNDFETINERTEAAGFTNAVGLSLRKLRTNLPDLAAQKKQLMDRQQEISDKDIRRIEVQQLRYAVSDVESRVEEFLARNSGALDESNRDVISDQYRKLIQAEMRYLDGVNQDLISYLDRLATLDDKQRELVKQSAFQAEYIAKNILFVRSTTAAEYPKLITDASRSLSRIGRDALQLVSALSQDAVDRPIWWGAACLVFCFMLFFRGHLRERVHANGVLATKRVTTSMKPTFDTVGLTVLITSIWPALLLFIGWRLSGLTVNSMCGASASALKSTAVLLLGLDVFRHICRPQGLGESHFGWPSRLIDTIRASLRLVVFTVVPLTFLVLMTERLTVVVDSTVQLSDMDRTSVGRLSLVGALLIAAFAIHRVLRPGGCAIDEVNARHPRNWFIRTRYFWYAFGVGLPLLLSVLAMAGYLYTSRQLAQRLIASGWLLLAVVIAAALLRRWQLLTYRAMAMEQARERRAALQQEADKTGVALEPDAPGVIFEDQAANLSDSNVQLGKLLSILFATVTIIGLGAIWSDVLPAFGFLGNFRLWESGIPSEVVDGVEKYEWITLMELLMAFGVVAVTVFAARNAPGLLEFAVLRRLPFDAGARYATSTVCRYSITVIGFVLAFRFVGLGWANVQWLVAAMTVGLGFGLQEIFANFVSGLILLFERPIRVGDTVTVGDIDGTVTRIRIRATTIIDWDRKELVVPNREFVTGQLINWTLSDAVLRIILRVGVAYGSDTQLTTDLLYKVAADEPNVLDDPPPLVAFSAFGESSLDFELRCFVGSPQIYRTISHPLNMAIDNAFREHNIEIAFPQRDLHIRSIEAPLAVTGREKTGTRIESVSDHGEPTVVRRN